ncbi:MAG: hypothetical protein WCV84_05050 [Patescibacteria group bacterium]
MHKRSLAKIAETKELAGALKGKSIDPAQYAWPHWYQLIKLLRGPATIRFHWIGDTLSVLLSILFVVQLRSTPLAIVPAVFFALGILLQRVLDWKSERTRLAELARMSPRELLLHHLQVAVEQERDRAIGGDSKLTGMLLRLQRQEHLMARELYDLYERIKTRTGPMRAALEQSAAQTNSVFRRLRHTRGALKAQLDRLEQHFATCIQRIQSLREPLEDLSLLERLADMRAVAEEEIERFETLVAQEIAQVQQFTAQLKEDIEAHVPTQAATLFAKGDPTRLEEDLVVCERVMAEIMQAADIPALNTSSSPSLLEEGRSMLYNVRLDEDVCRQALADQAVCTPENMPADEDVYDKLIREELERSASLGEGVSEDSIERWMDTRKRNR